MPALRFSKQIADSVHGPIGLTDVELAVIATPAFQRLRNVRQLGLAHYVYPGAGYSRFDHSVGVCHLAGRAVEGLVSNGVPISDSDAQLVRLAALLHDVGHYPFSHCTEHALRELGGRSAIELVAGDDGSPGQSTARTAGVPSHEDAGRYVLTLDKDIKSALERHDVRGEDVASIFKRSSPERVLLSNLLSADLDVDRLDYLVRTAHHAGLPSCTVDVGYLMTQLVGDAEGNLCLRRKALRAAEHMLLARYFNYQQVVYHKAVVGLESILQQLMIELVERGLVPLRSHEDLQEIISNGKWSRMDDTQVMELVRSLLEDPDERTRAYAASVALRHPPRMLWEDQEFRDIDEKGEFEKRKATLATVREELIAELGLPEWRVFPWSQGRGVFTKLPARKDPTSDDDHATAVRILDYDQQTSKRLTAMSGSLMKVLSNYTVDTTRLYLLLDADQHDVFARAKDFLVSRMPPGPQ